VFPSSEFVLPRATHQPPTGTRNLSHESQLQGSPMASTSGFFLYTEDEEAKRLSARSSPIPPSWTPTLRAPRP
jgi:hypothetical protein